MARRSGVRAGLAVVVALAIGCAPEAADRSPSQSGQSTRTRSALPVELPLDSALALAEATYESLDHAGAREMFRALLGRARSVGDVAAEAVALTGLGLVEWNLADDYQEAHRLLVESLELKVEAGLADQLFSSYNALGLLAWTQNRLPDAAANLDEAIRLGAAGGEVGQVATARMNLALVQTEWGDFRAAREGFLAMRDTMAEFGQHFDPPDRAFRMGAALTNLGMLDVRVGNPAAAVAWLLEAVEVFRDGNPAGVSYPMGHLATAYSLLGEQSRAFAVLDTALLQVRAQGLRQEEASNLEVLAEQYREAGDFQRALDLYDQAKVINAELGLTIETGADLRGEAEVHLALGAPERALASAEQALTLHRQAGAALDALYDLLVLAEIEDRVGRSEQTTRHLVEARVLSEQLDVRSARVALALTEARIADLRSDPEGVLEALRSVGPEVARGGYADQWQSHHLASKAHAAAGRADSAVAAGWLALTTVERVRESYGSSALRTAFSSDKREVYAQLVNTLLRAGRTEEAFGISDRARGRALVEDALVAPGSASDVSRMGELHLREIDGVLESIDALETGVTGVISQSDVAALDELYGRLDELRRAYEALIVRTGGRSGVSYPGRTEQLTIEDVRAALAEGEALVEYFVPGSGIIRIFVLSSNGLAVLDAPLSAGNLISRVRVVRDLMARPGDPAAAHAVLEGLHDALLRPVIETGLLDGIHRLVFVPHDALSYLPPAALRNAESGRFVIEDFEVRIVPRAAALLADARGTSVGEEGWRGGTVFAPLPSELPGTRREAEAVSDALRGARRLVGPEATEVELRRALQEAAPVHVATHGIMNTRSPMFSRVLLAEGTSDRSEDDGRLEVHELIGFEARAPLVFLSGCETGLGRSGATRFSRGEDYITLAGALLQSGVNSVIATLWRVDDEASATFARSFYEALGTQPPPAALAAAQREFRSHPRYSAPYYWAGYQLLGASPGASAAQ